MAIKSIQVDESQANEPGVQKKLLPVEGAEPLPVYVKVMSVDDLTKSVTDDVQTLTYARPMWVEATDDSEGYWDVEVRDIDLGKKNRDAFLKALEKFDEVSRPVVKKATAKKTTKRTSESREEAAKVREWAQELGLEVSDRGRIPENIVNAYRKANAGKA